MLCLSLLLASALAAAAQATEAVADPRDAYDVKTYRLDLTVDPARREISGVVAIELEPLADGLDFVRFDLTSNARVERVSLLEGELTAQRGLAGRLLEFEHRGDTLDCPLGGRKVKAGDRLSIAIRYSVKPVALNIFDGVHWEETPSGEPWVSTSCQQLGAHTWWPCKASFFSPEDKCERLFVNLSVPKGLVAVSNGRLTRRSPAAEGWETFHWRHDYPIETYSVTANVAPFVITEQRIELPGHDRALPFVTYFLPEDVAKAKVQFEDVPVALAIFSEKFGSYPFPNSKIGIVQTSFLGMDHATAIGYGSTFPKWRKREKVPDPNKFLNRYLDHVLIHELAHEWWGNSVSAASWNDFWLHEGFTTYSQAVYIEFTKSRHVADLYFRSMRDRVGRDSTLYPGKGEISTAEAFSQTIYYKGAWVLNTLRHQLDNDVEWWRTLRAFHDEYKLSVATTEDFRSVLEAETKSDWSRFFEEWVYGKGYPMVSGRISAAGSSILVEIDNKSSDTTGFHVPIDLHWRNYGRALEQRILLKPGRNELEIEVGNLVKGLEVRGLSRVLGRHRIDVP